MARLQLPPTRSNLISIKQRLDLAQQGYSLLDRKRDVLMMEIVSRIEKAGVIQKQVDEQFARAYQMLEQARAFSGTEQLEHIALMRSAEPVIRITPRSIMGVPVPTVRCDLPENNLTYGFGDTSVTVDQARQEWIKAMELMREHAEVVTTIWRLAFELRRTQRRVNALEHVFIPSYQETLTYIEDTLEEKEREELFRMKRAKNRTDEAQVSA